MAATKTLTKLFTAQELAPATPPTGDSLEEKVNAFTRTLTPANVLDVQFNLSKNGKYGENPCFTASVVYKGE